MVVLVFGGHELCHATPSNVVYFIKKQTVAFLCMQRENKAMLLKFCLFITIVNVQKLISSRIAAERRMQVLNVIYHKRKLCHGFSFTK